MRTAATATLLASLLLASTLALAQEAPPAQAMGPQHRLSVTFAPILAIGNSTNDIEYLRVFEFMGEYALDPKTSVVGVLGIGSAKGKDTAFVKYDPMSIFEAGAQGRYYVLGGFEHGLNLGLDALYLKASGTASSTSGNQNAVAVGEGFAAGPFIGYKVIASFGLTFDAHLGARYMLLQADAKSNSGQSASDSESRWGPLLRLNVGWSF